MARRYVVTGRVQGVGYRNFVEYTARKLGLSGFVRNLRDGFYRLGVIMADPRIPQASRLMRVWDEITQRLQAA